MQREVGGVGGRWNTCKPKLNKHICLIVHGLENGGGHGDGREGRKWKWRWMWRWRWEAQLRYDRSVSIYAKWGGGVCQGNLNQHIRPIVFGFFRFGFGMEMDVEAKEEMEMDAEMEVGGTHHCVTIEP